MGGDEPDETKDDAGDQSDASSELPKFLNVEQCRASLPISISRKEVIRYIRMAGPEFYQEHRRQIFLTRDQWMAVVSTIHPPCYPGRRNSSTDARRTYARVLERTKTDMPKQSRSAAAAYEKALALTASDMPRPRASGAKSSVDREFEKAQALVRKLMRKSSTE